MKHSVFTSFTGKCASESIPCILQYFLPDLGVIVRVTPAHLHGANQRVLPKHFRAKTTIHVSTLLQRKMGQTQHEGKNGAFHKKKQAETHIKL